MPFREAAGTKVHKIASLPFQRALLLADSQALDFVSVLLSNLLLPSSFKHTKSLSSISTPSGFTFNIFVRYGQSHLDD